MPNNNITVTSVAGVAQAVTATVFNNVKGLNFDFVHEVLFIDTGNKVVEVSLSPPIATVTYTVSSNVATVAVS